MKESEGIASEYLQELEWAEVKMEHMAAQAKLDRDQVEMEFQVRMTLLKDRLEAAEIEAEVERLKMERHIRQLQAQLDESGGHDSSRIDM